MKERFIELINSYPCMSTVEDCFIESISDDLADYLLDNGVVVVDSHVVSPKNLPLITHIAGYPIDEVIDLMEAKNTGRIVELPCAVGDTVYWINRVKKEIETDIVVAIHHYVDSFLITTETIGTKCGSTYSLNRFLEIMHFTKEEAEKALERSEGK